MIKLRTYQLEAIDCIKKTFETEFRQYIELPTGAGKTITFLSYAKENHKRILIIVPSKELLRQVYQTSLLFFERHDISRKGAKHDESPKNVHICIINSIRGDYLENLAKHPFDLVIVDEAHHIQAKSYRNFLDKKLEFFHEKEVKILGVTATPDRADGQLINELLYTRSFSISIEQLINEKYLSDIEGFAIKTNLDISDIDDHNGDFSITALYKKLGTTERDNLILTTCQKEMQNRKTLIFCINIQHSKQLCKKLNASGLNAFHIDGSMDDSERSSILSAFRNGEISFLCNCQLLTEGFDEPSIDGIILARPTKSRALFTQMIGRGLRIFPGKNNCKIIDLVDNHRRKTGFNCLLTEDKFSELESFKSLSDIQKHVSNEILKNIEVNLIKTNLLNFEYGAHLEPTSSMISQLESLNIIFFEPITFDEANFLLWQHNLKKEISDGFNKQVPQ